MTDPGPADPLRSALRPYGTSIFSTLTELAVRHQAVNLAQGFPDFEPPAPLLDAAADALRSGWSQYAPSIGYPELRQAVAAHQLDRYGRQVDPDTEVTVTVGATEAIWSAVEALTEPGDEVLLFEPYYDMYPAAVAAAGCVPRVVPGTGFPDLRIDLDRLTAAVGPRTRLAILNTPTNPTGRTVGAQELQVLGQLCERYGVTVIADEAYEHVVLDGRGHLPVAAEPALAGRTVTVSSASKTFSATGWRVGWAVAPPALTGALRRVHQFVTFAASSPLQRAVGTMLAAAGPDFYAGLAADYGQRRRRRGGLLRGPDHPGRGGGDPGLRLPCRPRPGPGAGPVRVLQAAGDPARGGAPAAGQDGGGPRLSTDADPPLPDPGHRLVASSFSRTSRCRPGGVSRPAPSRGAGPGSRGRCPGCGRRCTAGSG